MSTTAAEIEKTLRALITCNDDANLELEDATGREVSFNSVRSFEDAGVLTADSGLVLTLSDGSKFQITIIKSGR
jgi:hypothetical protein